MKLRLVFGMHISGNETVLRMLLVLHVRGCVYVHMCAAEPRVLALTSQQGASADQEGLVEQRGKKK